MSVFAALLDSTSALFVPVAFLVSAGGAFLGHPTYTYSGGKPPTWGEAVGDGAFWLGERVRAYMAQAGKDAANEGDDRASVEDERHWVETAGVRLVESLHELRARLPRFAHTVALALALIACMVFFFALAMISIAGLLALAAAQFVVIAGYVKGAEGEQVTMTMTATEWARGTWGWGWGMLRGSSLNGPTPSAHPQVVVTNLSNASSDSLETAVSDTSETPSSSSIAPASDEMPRKRRTLPSVTFVAKVPFRVAVALASRARLVRTA